MVLSSAKQQNAVNNRTTFVPQSLILHHTAAATAAVLDAFHLCTVVRLCRASEHLRRSSQRSESTEVKILRLSG